MLEDILEPAKNPDLYGDVFHKVSINYYPPRGDNKEGWDNIDIFGWLGYPMQIKVDFLCRDSILAAPLALDLVLFSDLAQRAGLGGIQEWLSFYYKSPQVAPGLYAEHDLFIQLTKLKNTLRWMMGEEQITHLGREYYDDAPTPTKAEADHRRGRRAGQPTVGVRPARISVSRCASMLPPVRTTPTRRPRCTVALGHQPGERHRAGRLGQVVGGAVQHPHRLGAPVLADLTTRAAPGDRSLRPHRRRAPGRRRRR